MSDRILEWEIKMLTLMFFGMLACGGYIASRSAKSAASNAATGIGGGLIRWILKK